MIGKYRMQLIGALVGPIWWPSGLESGLTIEIDLVREAGRCGRGVTLRQLLMLVMAERGGDFQSCNFTSDTEIVVTRDTGIAAGHRTKRSTYWPITAFKSVRDMVKEGTFANDYG